MCERLGCQDVSTYVATESREVCCVVQGEHENIAAKVFVITDLSLEENDGCGERRKRE